MKLKLTLITACLSFVLATAYSATTQHPNIFVTQDARDGILELIEENEWAESMVLQLHQNVDESVDEHLKNPAALFKDITPFPENDHINPEGVAGPTVKIHNFLLSMAADASLLYFITEETKYAQFSANILTAYFNRIDERTQYNMTFCGYHFFDARTAYSPLAIAYDFTYNYLQKSSTKVYDEATKGYVKFDNAKAQKSIATIIGAVFKEFDKPDIHGQVVSNHPILTAPGALYNILCIDDLKERDRLLDLFWNKGTAHQNSFKNTIIPLFSDQGIWPESVSYGFMPIVSMVINIIDRAKPEWNVTADCMHILEGNFFFDYLRNPDRTFVSYGDSHRYNDSTGNLYRYTLDIAARKGYTELQKKAELALSQSYRARGGYDPKVSTSMFDNASLLQLLWGRVIPSEVGADVDFNVPTVVVEHAGVALQRNAVEEDNNIYGLCGVIGGAHYVHSHLTGISMELYGSEYVMAPNAALPPSVAQRQIPLHEHYFRIYAGNNTVVVNGTSHGLDEGSWKGNANVWQNRAVNIAAEPQHLEDPLSKNFSFATQRLDDNVNNCTQERTLAIVRTSSTSAYYFDMFRSISLDENKFHDYIYHNIGDEMHLTTEHPVSAILSPTDRYQNDIGDTVHSPGWRYFEDTRSTSPISQALNVRFDVNYDDRYMHMFLPAGVSRQYTKALAPPTREARNGYVNKKTQVLVVRQNGEAWNRPFISVFEPSTSKTSSVESVAPLYSGKKIVGAKVVSNVDGSVITDYIINNDSDGAQYSDDVEGIEFTGRYAVVRTIVDGGQTQTNLYIGDGSKLSYNGSTLKAKHTKGFKVIK